MKGKFLKKFLILSLLLSISVSISGISFIYAKSTSWPKCPAVKAKGVVVLDLKSGVPLIKKNADKKWYPASTTKIMTALLAIENAESLDEKVEFTREAVERNEIGGSNIGIRPGEKLTLRECLYGMLLASANEAANALAIHTSGSIEEFAELMNKRARELGCTKTHFKNPSGLYEKGHYTTPMDLAKIAKAAIENEDFRKISGTATHVIPKTNLMKEKRPVSNTNQLLNPVKLPQYGYEYCYSGKTGYTPESRYNLVSYAKKGTMDVACVLMGAENRDAQFSNSIKLLEYAFKRFRMLQTQKIRLPLEKEEVVSHIFENDPEAEFTVSGAALLAVPKKCDVNGVVTEITTDNIRSVAAGDNCIGSVKYKYDGKYIGCADIIYKSKKSYSFDKAKENFKDNEKKGKKINYKMVVLIVIAAVIALVLLWYIIIYLNPKRMIKRGYRKNKRIINNRNRFKF